MMRRRLEALESRQLLTATLVSDFNTDPQSGAPNHLTLLNEAVYFFTDGTAETQLWKTDGSVAGTEIVVELESGGGNPFTPECRPFVHDGIIYFVANSMLWTSDGSAEGTQPINLLRQNISEDASWAVSGDDVYLWDPQVQMLWVTQGTQDTTSLVYAADPSFDEPSALRELRCDSGRKRAVHRVRWN